MPGLGKNPGNSKNPWEWEKLVFTGKNEKNGKNCLFFTKNMFKKYAELLVNK
jgi:hypothetical protein